MARQRPVGYGLPRRPGSKSAFNFTFGRQERFESESAVPRRYRAGFMPAVAVPASRPQRSLGRDE